MTKIVFFVAGSLLSYWLANIPYVGWALCCGFVLLAGVACGVVDGLTIQIFGVLGVLSGLFGHWFSPFQLGDYPNLYFFLEVSCLFMGLAFGLFLIYGLHGRNEKK